MVDGDASGVIETLRHTERRRLAAFVAVDLPTLESLHADDYELIPPSGRPLSRADYLGSVADGSLRYDRFEPMGEIRVRLLGTSAAALRYRADMVVAWTGGRDVTQLWHTDIYEFRDGRWQAVWSQATGAPTE